MIDCSDKRGLLTVKYMKSAEQCDAAFCANRQHK